MRKQELTSVCPLRSVLHPAPCNTTRPIPPMSPTLGPPPAPNDFAGILSWTACVLSLAQAQADDRRLLSTVRALRCDSADKLAGRTHALLSSSTVQTYLGNVST